MTAATNTQSGYITTLQSAIDSTTGAKTLTMADPLEAFGTDDILILGYGTTREEWAQVTDITPGSNQIEITLRGLSLTNLPLEEVAANRQSHVAGEICAIVTFGNKIHTRNADTGTTSTTFEIGIGSDSVKFDITGQTSDHVFMLPDENDELAGIDSAQEFNNKILTSPVINTGVSGSAISSGITAPGSASILATTEDVVNYVAAISPGVLSIQVDGGTQREDYIDFISGKGVKFTDNGDDSFTADIDTESSVQGSKLESAGADRIWIAPTLTVVADAATVTLDGSVATSGWDVDPLAANVVFSWSNLYNGMRKELEVQQDATGSRLVTFNVDDYDFGDGDVDTTDDEIVVQIPTGTGTRIRFTGGDLPDPIAAATTYYAIYVDATHIQVATTLANAFAGTEITITDVGSGARNFVTYPNYAEGTAPVATTTAWAIDRFICEWIGNVMTVYELALDLKGE